MDPEFSGVCHHVNLSCYNPSERPKCPLPPPHTHAHIHLFYTHPLNTDPLLPIEVCLPADERIIKFRIVSRFTYLIKVIVQHSLVS